MSYKIGLNAYGLRFVLGEGTEYAMRTIHACGMESFEPMINFEQPGANQNPKYPNMVWDVDTLIGGTDAIEACGIQIKSVHVAYGADADTALMVENMRRLHAAGVDTFVFADAGMRDREALHATERVIAAAIDGLADTDARILYHPHENEFEQVEGERLIDTLLSDCPQLGLQPDIGWIVFAGEDPAAFIERYADRVHSVHFKDLIAEYGLERRRISFTAVGTGVVDTDAIVALLPQLHVGECGVIICQDSSNGDYLEDLRAGVKYLKEKTEA